MFSFINKLFQTEKAPDMHPFYGACVELNGREICLKRNNGDDEKIQIKDIDYISIYRFDYMDTHDRCWLNFRSYTQPAVSVCTLAGNFAAIEQFANSLPGFDSQQYAAIRASKAEVKETVLWQKVHQPDFDIAPLPTQQVGDALSLLQQGLWIENKNTLVAWGTYDELAKHPLVKTQLIDFPNPLFTAKSYTIAKPTLFNGLKLSSLVTECDAAEGDFQLHLPVIQYRAQLSLGVNRQKSFDSIKTHLDTFFKQNATAQLIDYAVKDTWRISWHEGAAHVELYCFYREVPDGWDNTAWLTIQYSPNLDRFYQNDYQRDLVLNQSITYQQFDFSLDLNTDYRRVDNAIYTPDCFKTLLSEAQPLIIWHDTAEQVIGFAAAEYALVFNANEVQHLTLAVQNFRGSEGRNSLELNVQNQNVPIGSVSNVAVFKKNMQKIAKLIGKKVDAYTYDEHY